MYLTPRDLRRQQELEATRAVRRDAAVAAATHLFAQRGFHATAIADVAKTAGLSLKALYEVFSSKEALFEAVLADVGERFSALLEEPGPAENPRVWLLGFVDRLVAMLASNSSALCLYSRGADGIPAALRNKGVNPFTGFMLQVAEMLAAVIRDAQDKGLGGDGIEPAVLARAILNMVITETRHRLEVGQPVQSAAADLSSILAAILRNPV